MADDTLHARSARGEKRVREGRARIIYALTTAHDNYAPRYVGTTIAKPQRRLAQHLSLAQTACDWPVYRWIRARLDAGHEIIMLCLERDVPSADVERGWIAWAKQRGARVLNLTHGGYGPGEKVLSPEHRAAISRGVRASSTWAPWNRGKSATPEHREAVSAGLLRSGRDYTEQAKKASERMRGSKLPPHQIAAMKAAKRGPWTEAQRAARAAADATPKVKARRSAAARRQFESPEARQDLSERGRLGALKRWGTKPP